MGCARSCRAKKHCTSFDLSGKQIGTKQKCLLYHHKHPAPASGVPGNCYLLHRMDEKEIKHKLEAAQHLEQPKQKTQKKEQPPKSGKIKKEKAKEKNIKHQPENKKRPKRHAIDLEKQMTPKEANEENVQDDTNDIYDKLGIDQEPNENREKIVSQTLEELKRTYEDLVRPLESMYKHEQLSQRFFRDPEIFHKPLIVVTGPDEEGRSTLINYFLGNARTNGNTFLHNTLLVIFIVTQCYLIIDDSLDALFGIFIYGDQEETMNGPDLISEWEFPSLQNFGDSFLDVVEGIKIPSKLLKRVRLIT